VHLLLGPFPDPSSRSAVNRAGRAVLIGVGNAYRQDDGIGPVVVAAISEQLKPDGVTALVSDGEPSRLLDAWSGAELAVVVDAVRSEQDAQLAPGRFRRSQWPALAATEHVWLPASSASTHGLGLREAVSLGQALGRMPERLVIFAVEAAEIGYGRHLSEAVAARLPDLTRAVLAEFEVG
jgi:hydrogenase maturation protease